MLLTVVVHLCLVTLWYTIPHLVTLDKKKNKKFWLLHFTLSQVGQNACKQNKYHTKSHKVILVTASKRITALHCNF